MDEFELDYLNFKKEEALINKRKEIYKDLSFFEIVGGKKEKEFEDALELLSEINKLIKDNINIKKHVLLEMIDASVHIKNELLLGRLNDDECIIQDSTDLSSRYLFNKIFNIVIEEIEKLKKEEQLQNYSKVKYGIPLSSYLIYCDELFNNDINRIFLSMIQDSIDKSDNEDIKEELIEAKYNLIFMNDHLESEMLLNNFEVDKNILITAGFYMSFSNMPKEINTSIFSGIILDNLKKTQSVLKKYKKKDGLLDSKTILRTCYMRANLFLIDEDSIIKSNVGYYDEISKRKNTNPDGDILITDTYNKSLEDKRLYRGIGIK